MTTIKDKGAVILAAVSLCIALAGWMRADAGRSQQIADLQGEVAQLSQQMQQMRHDLDAYLFVHDGH